MFNGDQIGAFMAQTREEVIARLVELGYIHLLPPEQQGRYLFGKTSNGRAICLVWGLTKEEECANREVIVDCFEEIRVAGLQVPFVIFGATSTILAQSWKFLQLPHIFEQGLSGRTASEILLRSLQKLNMDGTMHYVQVSKADAEARRRALEEALNR